MPPMVITSVNKPSKLLIISFKPPSPTHKPLQLFTVYKAEISSLSSITACECQTTSYCTQSTG